MRNFDSFRRIGISAAAASLLLLLLLSSPAAAGGAVGAGVITLPPIVTKYDEDCLDRIDKTDRKLAARQSRECRKPRGSRNALPVARGPERAPEPIRPR